MKVRDVLKRLADDGWILVRTRGSHRQFKHPKKPGRVNGRRKSERRRIAGHVEQHSEASRMERVGIVMKRYAVVIEKGPANFSGYVPDLPGCIATGATLEETEQLLREAIELHLEGLAEDGMAIPEPSSVVDYVNVA